MEQALLPQDEGDRDISTVSSILEPDILTWFSKHVCMMSRSQQPGACKNILAASLCVCMCTCISMCRKEREEKAYVEVEMGLRVNKESCLLQKVLSCVPSVTFWPKAFAQFSKTPAVSSYIPLLTTMYLFPSFAESLGFKRFVFPDLSLLWSYMKTTCLAAFNYSFVPPTSFLDSELCVDRHLEEHLSCMGCKNLCAQADVTSPSLPTGGSTSLPWCCE